MREMEEDDEENYQKHFAKYLDIDVEADDLEDLYSKVHQSIRADPTPEEKKPFTPDKSYKKGIKKSYEQRKADAQAKKDEIRAANAGDDDDDDE